MGSAALATAVLSTQSYRLFKLVHVCPRGMVAMALTSFARSVGGANFVMALNAMAERRANFSLAYLESSLNNFC